MAQYVVVESGVITEYYDSLPTSWRNTSGLNMSANDVNFLLSLGWYSVQKNSVSYDPDTHYISSYDYVIEDTYVTETPVITELPEDQKQTFERKKEDFLAQLRSMRTEKLLACDWTQLVDSPLSEENKLRWQTYRQALRDLPGVYQSNNVIDINSVVWPEF